MTKNEVIKILKGAYSLLLQTRVKFEDVRDYKNASEEAIKALEEAHEYRKLGTVEEVREAVEKQKPKKINHIHKEYNEHLWERYENGKINDMAFESGYHYGPICERCGYSFCVGCDPEGWDKEKCVTDDYLCPTCGTYVGMIGSYCKECGQRLEE